MCRSYGMAITVLLAMLAGFVQPLPGQTLYESERYEVSLLPDLWYNTVDGVSVGARLQGGAPGDLLEGPFRTLLAFRLATRWPDVPVSYRLRIQHPVIARHDPMNEGIVELSSRFQAGFQAHGLGLQKRWQTGGEVSDAVIAAARVRYYDRFDAQYLAYPQLWQSQQVVSLHGELQARGHNPLGRYRAGYRHTVGLPVERDGFHQGVLTAAQHLKGKSLFSLRTRGFLSYSAGNLPAEKAFLRSLPSPLQWQDSRWLRARGPVPTAMMDRGGMHLAGGPGLRGFLAADAARLAMGEAQLYRAFAAVNTELDVPNPLGRYLDRRAIVGDVLAFRSYVFADAGVPLGPGDPQPGRIMADAGAGVMLSFDIPDFRGRERGFHIRYEVPFLVHQGGSSSFAFRHHAGVGAQIPF